MPKLIYVPLSEIKRIRLNIADRFLLSKIISGIVRINALYMIRNTGSGHIGSSFSSADIVTWLWTQEMINPNDGTSNPGDIYFSSKGHDAPALYSLLIALEKLDFDLIHKLRRLGGLPGHPDRTTPYMVTNTGSLGMGISKARGMVLAKRLRSENGRVYVLTGDGELQEGQIWESLQPAVNSKCGEITVIIDHNKLQSDISVQDTSDLGNLEDKFKSFGWEVARCSGHDFEKISQILNYFRTVKDKPQVLIADTVKGKGVSFMEKIDEVEKIYKFHSGAPSYDLYEKACEELIAGVNSMLAEAKQRPLEIVSQEVEPPIVKQDLKKLIPAYADELIKIAKERKDVVVMDGDLVLDTGLIPFKKEFPDRYIECGISEQDMVSVAGGMALKGFLPVVHSFSCFLTTRPNEQIFNNSTEKTKIIYVGSLAGLLPAMPGHSHQSVRDIALMGSVPGLMALEPGSEEEARLAVRWAIEKNPESTYIRLVSIPCDIPYSLPSDYQLIPGRGLVIKEGSEVAVVTYGPVMLSEAWKAAEKLAEKGISVAVINFPWLNKIDQVWLSKNLSNFSLVVTLDNHLVKFGQGQQIADSLAKNGVNIPKIISLGIEDIPVCGNNEEVLKSHKLDAQNIADKIFYLRRSQAL